MRYYLHENGGWLTISGDDTFTTVPPGFVEVTEEEFNAASSQITLPAPPAEPEDDGDQRNA
ncbi:hypothetical protein [[Kitasatospora] papulosa]|uniref:hypothetical protein n=1 Tax=[Kitasatospora] papulosa TaxID=1464011 RepID=UPI0036A9ECFF